MHVVYAMVMLGMAGPGGCRSVTLQRRIWSSVAQLALVATLVEWLQECRMALAHASWLSLLISTPRTHLRRRQRHGARLRSRRWQ